MKTYKNIYNHINSATALSWRCIAVCVCTLIFYMFTGELVKASVVALICDAVKTLLYILHEKLWERL